jgi:hypothetical protein
MGRPPAPVNRAEFDQLIETLEADRRMRKETHALVMGLHRALIEPEPGHDHGLLHRMAAVTIAAETGRAAGERIVWWAKVVAAAGVIFSAIMAAIRFGRVS